MKPMILAALIFSIPVFAHAGDAETDTPKDTAFTRSCQGKPGDSTCALYFERVKESEVRECCEEVARDPVAMKNYANENRGDRKSLFESCVIGMSLVYCD